MKPILILLTFALTIYSEPQTSLSVNLQATSIQTTEDWARIKLKVYGGVEPYDFTFTIVPQKWKQVKDQLYIPLGQVKQPMKYPCYVIIKDEANSQIRTAVVFMIDNSNVKVYEKSFGYYHIFQDQFFDDGIYKGRPQMIQRNDLPKNSESSIFKPRTREESEELVVTSGSGLGTIIASLFSEDDDGLTEQMEKIQRIVKKEAKSTSTARSIDSIFEKLPSSSDLDKIILKKDAFLILKSIQGVVRSQVLGCHEKIAYISDFFGRIQSAIEIKLFTLSQLKIIIQGAQQEIFRLQKQIQYAKGDIESLDFGEISEQLSLHVKDLEEAYDKFNQNFEKIGVKEQQFEQLEQKSVTLKEKLLKETRNLNKYQNQLFKIDKQVQELEQLIAEKKKQRLTVKKKIGKISGVIREIKIEQNFLEKNIQKAKFQIKQLKSISDRLKNEYSQIQIEIQRLRDDSDRKTEKETFYIEKIEKINHRIRNERNKLAFREVEILENFVKVLTESLPNIQEEVDKIYYECFEVENVETETIDGNIVYKMSGEGFKSYMEKTYEISDFYVSSPSSSFSLTTYHILSGIWKRTYGEVFDDNSIAHTNEFSFEEDFNCLNPSTLEVGFGRILSVSGKTIRVRTTLGEMLLKLSPCSRIESSSVLPRVGQRIYWKANQIEPRIMEVYAATCME